MRNNKKQLIIIAAILLVFTTVVNASSTGVTPSVMDMGTIERGETVRGDFYITSTFDQNYTLRPEAGGAMTSRVFNPTSSYLDPNEVSEQGTSNWIEFPDEEFEVTPDDENTVVLPSGSAVNAKGHVWFYLTIPEDAEPGIHSGTIRVNPQFQEETGYGARTQTESVFRYRFRVPGEANRNLDIIDVRAFRTGENTVRIDQRVQNRGTVTSVVRSSDLSILDLNQQEVDDLSMSSVRIPPGESRVVSSHWNTDVEGGRYFLNGSMDYMTGKASVSQSFSFIDRVDVSVTDESTDTDTTDDSEMFPYWFILMFLSILGVIMYGFEIDPVWILFVTGLVGISSFVWVTPVTNYLILLVLTSSGLIIYYGIE